MNIIIPVRILTKYIKNEPQDIWDPFRDISDNLNDLDNRVNLMRLDQHLDDSRNHQDEKFKSCIATLISYGNEYYVITCYHGIQNNVDIHLLAKLGDEVISCKMDELYSLKEYDFSVLRFCNKDDISKIREYEGDHQNNSIMNIKFLKGFPNNFKINYLSYEGDEGDQEYKEYEGNEHITGKLHIKQIRCEHIGYSISKIRSELYPPIPIIDIKINDILDDLSYEGLSGSLVTDHNDKVHGMISHYNIEYRTFCVIPSYCLKLFFVMSLTNDKVKSFCLSTKVCNFIDDRTGHIITKGYNIVYKTVTDRDIKFKNYDLIECINDIPFDDSGNLYFKRIGIYVPLDTYFILENTKYHKFKYHVKKDLDNYVQAEKSIYPVPLEKYIRFDLEYHKKIIKYQGLVITEMSEQLLSYYDNLGIKISGKVEDHYNDCYSAINQKLVVIINIEYNKLPSNIFEIYKLIGLPLIRDTGGKYLIPIISKVDDIKINNLDEMEKIIFRSESYLSVRLEIAQKKAITLNYEGTNLFIK